MLAAIGAALPTATPGGTLTLATVPAWLSWVYYLSSPALVVLTAAGLTGLFLTKRDFTVRVRREAASLAASANATLSEETDSGWPRAKAYMSQLGLLGDTDFDVPEKPTYEIAELTALVGEIAVQALRDLEFKRYNELLRRLNSLEQYAIYVIKGLADEDIAHAMWGLTYTAFADDLYAMICVTREDDASLPEECRPCYYTIALRNRWKQRESSEVARQALARARSAALATEPPAPQTLLGQERGPQR